MVSSSSIELLYVINVLQCSWIVYFTSWEMEILRHCLHCLDVELDPKIQNLFMKLKKSYRG